MNSQPQLKMEKIPKDADNDFYYATFHNDNDSTVTISLLQCYSIYGHLSSGLRTKRVSNQSPRLQRLASNFTCSN